VNYLVASRIPEGYSKNDKDRFFHLVKFFIWDKPYLFKYCSDQVFRRCIPDHEMRSVISFCHDQACEGHFSGRKTAAKVLQCGFYKPTLFKHEFEYCKSCPRCQRLGRISRRDMMSLNPIIVLEVFDVRGIDFMRQFPSSFVNEYILLVVDYVSKWVEVIPSRTNEAKVVVKFLRENIFFRFGMPCAIISDQGTHFNDESFDALPKRYSIVHRLATLYHPQTSGQVEVSNQQIK